MKKQVYLSLAFIFIASLSQASTNPFRIPDTVDQEIQKGLNEIFNLEFSTAVKTFESIQTLAPEHPMVLFGLASAHWWRLSVYVLEPDPEESKPFLDTVQTCIKLSEAKIKEGDPTGEGNLVLGGILGLWGRYEATNHRWMPAYSKGKKAIKHLRRALQKNPELIDAYLGLGIFDYYVATLPSFVRVLAFLGSGGDPQKGIDELNMAAEKSFYSKVPAKLFLVDLYANHLNSVGKALGILESLKNEYPKSAFIQMLELIALYNYGNLDELKLSAQNYKKKVDEGLFQDEWYTQAFFALGLVEFKSKNWGGAIHFFQKAIEANNTKDAFHTWAILYKGYALDAIGLRGEAVILYDEVLSRQRRWSSWDMAKLRLKKPFSENDEELKKLKL